MDFTRARIVSQARLHNVIAALSDMYFGTGGGLWEGDDDEGSYVYYNGMGDHFSIAWNDEAVVAAAFSDESEHAEYYLDEDERNPLANLDGLPEELQELAERAADAVERLVSSGLWSVGTDSGLSQPMDTNWADGLEQLAGFGMTPREALFGDELLQDWSQLFSLSPLHCEMVLSWIEALEESGSATITDADNVLLLEPPTEFAEVTVESAEDAADSFARVGLAWDVPVEEIEARADVDHF